MADRSRIRCIAICLIQHPHRSAIFVLEGFDPQKQTFFYRPLGGGIDMGETGAETIVREFKEETGLLIKNVGYVETLENIFTYKGKPGHEIVRVYRGDFDDIEMYECSEIIAHEDNGSPFKALWVDLQDFEQGVKRLVPEQLLSLI